MCSVLLNGVCPCIWRLGVCAPWCHRHAPLLCPASLRSDRIPICCSRHNVAPLTIIPIAIYDVFQQQPVSAITTLREVDRVLCICRNTVHVRSVFAEPQHWLVTFMARPCPATTGGAAIAHPQQSYTVTEKTSGVRSMTNVSDVSAQRHLHSPMASSGFHGGGATYSAANRAIRS